jgi:long-chain acyl-CoA synthetase
MTNFLVPLFNGSTIAFARSIKPKIILEDLVREGVTVFVTVPLLLEHVARLLAPGKKRSGRPGFIARSFAWIRKLFRAKDAGTGKGPSAGGPAAAMGKIRFCISGAAALRADVEMALSGAGLKILQGYGLTEASPVVAVNPLEAPKAGTVGPALPGVEIRIDRPNEEGIGEILVRGGNVMKEYYKNPEATAEALVDGILHTGDLGRIDEDGYLTIVGRKKSVIVTAGGKNVYPDEIESMLSSSNFILECIVLAVEDRRGNARPGAIIVPNYDALASIHGISGPMTEEKIHHLISEEIRKTCGDIAEYKRIIDFQIRDSELPRTATRKLKRHLVKWVT